MSLIYEVFGGIIRDTDFKFLLKVAFGIYICRCLCMCVFIYGKTPLLGAGIHKPFEGNELITLLSWSLRGLLSGISLVLLEAGQPFYHVGGKSLLKEWRCQQTP